MQKNNLGIINLDELLGDKTLSVRIGDEKYRIRSVKSLSPDEYGKIISISETLKNITDEQMRKDNGMYLQKIVDDLIQILAPDLPRYKPSWKERWFHFGYKRRFNISLEQMVAIMEFWKGEHQSQKKKTPTKLTKKKKKSR